MTTPEDEKKSNGSEFGPLRTFGRTGGRPLSTRQQKLMDELLPKLSVNINDHIASFDPNELFEEKPKEIWFEIGFGGAEHLIGQAQNNPDIGFIGCEPFLEGVAKAVTLIWENEIPNIRLHAYDARDILNGLADQSLDRVFIMFPDPWHKTKHHKRRLIQPEFLETLSRVLKPGGKVRFATDWANYADWALERFEQSPHFEWTATKADDWRIPPADHVTTRYQTKGLGDCKPVFLDFAKI